MTSSKHSYSSSSIHLTLLALGLGAAASSNTNANLRGSSGVGAIGSSIHVSDPNKIINSHRTNRHLFTFSNPSCTDIEYAEQPYYVSPNGNNWLSSNGWGLSPSKPFKTIQHAVDERKECQTIYIMEGTYRNTYYGQSFNHNNKVVNLNGVSDIKILADPNATSMPKLEFDGPGAFVGGTSSVPLSNIEIAGLDIAGPNANISYLEALSDRLNKRTYYTGRGIAIWAGHHVYIHDVKVHHCPGSGIRVNKGDYVTVADSEVYSNTWWSSSGESAIVLAEGRHVDDVEWVKMRLVGNLVYDNVNKIPYYNPNYAWNYSPIGSEDCSVFPACEAELVEGCPWECRYGKKTQDYIVDGMGVYVTRNKDTYLHGQMELADNVAHSNGINGVVFHRTDRGIVRRNMVFDNGIVPRLEYPESPLEDWMADLNKSRQPYSGIVINNAEGVKLWSNNVMARYEDDYAYNLEADGSGPPPPLAAGGNNKVCRGLVDEYIGDAVVQATDATECSAPAPPAVTSAPSRSPTMSPVAVPTTERPTVPAKYEEVYCGDACHLIQWPYNMGNAYEPSVARAACERGCDVGDCRAFSLQDDYRPNMAGMRRCFFYRESGEPSPEVCASDPFNRADGGSCVYETSNGQFFITSAAREWYNVNDKVG
mmetsp:Transcript_16663/g.36091  ORF Transcript_16663/g.36091 Transcript_16663/m.36091 type:complete len:650 (-) Transcript_16663:163-2112(-)